MELRGQLRLFLLMSAGALILLQIQLMRSNYSFDLMTTDLESRTETDSVGTSSEKVAPEPVFNPPKPGVNKLKMHRHWQTNCSALFAGDENVIKEASKMIQGERQDNKGAVSIPTDKEVQYWTLDCSLYKKVRQYPTKPGSDEEADFPLAYSMMIHKDASQVERLLRAIYQPQNIICIHPDKKSPDDFQKAIRGLANCFENVFIASRVDVTIYGEIVMVQGDINCINDLIGPIGAKYKWKYFLNLCGQDFPLKTNLEIIRQLKAYKGHNGIDVILLPKRHTNRVRNKGPAPHNMTLYLGNKFIAATRSFIEYVIHDPKGKDMLDWANGTYAPDEFFWSTLQRAEGTPGGYPIGNEKANVRYIRWAANKLDPAPCIGKYVREVCILEAGFLRYLGVLPHLFVNKVSEDFDPIVIQCLEEALNNRTMNPELSDKLIGFPVTKFPWANHTALP